MPQVYPETSVIWSTETTSLCVPDVAQVWSNFLLRATRCKNLDADSVFFPMAPYLKKSYNRLIHEIWTTCIPVWLYICISDYIRIPTARFNILHNHCRRKIERNLEGTNFLFWSYGTYWEVEWFTDSTCFDWNDWVSTLVDWKTQMFEAMNEQLEDLI